MRQAVTSSQHSAVSTSRCFHSPATVNTQGRALLALEGLAIAWRA